MTASSPAPQPRRWRLQFSLRLLLLALTAFAIGFPIWYRWPYEETEHKYADLRADPFAIPGPSTAKTPYATITKTWRRTWGGGKVQSGRVITEGTRGGIPKSKTIEYIENGQRHGPFEDYSNGKLVRKGAYANGQREGAWVEYDRQGNIVSTVHWHLDRLDGLYEIVRSDGRKQQFNFQHGRLTSLNGKPVQNRLLEQLAAGKIDDPRIASELPRAMSLPMEFVETPLKDAVMFLQDAYNIPIVIDARRVSDLDRPLTVNLKGIDLCSALTLLTAPHDLAFEYRYGVLVVTTAKHAQDPRDLTGVRDIRPPAGSPLARAWNEPCTIQVIQTPLDAALQLVAQPLAIDFDLSGLPPQDQTMLITKNLKLPLRHALGLVLDCHNLRAEVRDGDTIAILPGPDTDPPGYRETKSRQPTPFLPGQAPRPLQPTP